MSIQLILNHLAEYQGKTKTLTPDELACLKKELSEDLFATKCLLDFIAKGEVDQHMAYSILSVKEARLGDLTTLTGIELDSPLARNERYAALRQANERIRALESEIGAAVTAAHVGKALKVLSERLEYWWDVEGFGHTSETQFNKHGSLEVKFCCTLFGDIRLHDSKRPVTEKQSREEWHQSIADRGFELSREAGERDPSIVDNDNNRRLLGELFSKHFPSACITQTSNYFNVRTGKMELRDVTVFFRSLAEIEALPLPPQVS